MMKPAKVRNRRTFSHVISQARARAAAAVVAIVEPLEPIETDLVPSTQPEPVEPAEVNVDPVEVLPAEPVPQEPIHATTPEIEPVETPVEVPDLTGLSVKAATAILQDGTFTATQVTEMIAIEEDGKNRKTLIAALAKLNEEN